MTQKVHGLRRSRSHLLSLSVSESQELSCGWAEWFWLRDCHEIIVKTSPWLQSPEMWLGPRELLPCWLTHVAAGWEPRVLRHEPPFPHPLPPEHTPRSYLSLLAAWRVVSHRASIPREQSRNCGVFQSLAPKVTYLHYHRIFQVSQVNTVLSEETAQGGKAHWQPSWQLVTTGGQI